MLVNLNDAGERLIRDLLSELGENPDREGLVETPKRVMKAWRHWTNGYAMEAKDVLKTFEDGAEGTDEMVIVSNIPVYSKCEHHLADIFGLAHVGYIPNGRVVGLSKLARVVKYLRTASPSPGALDESNCGGTRHLPEAFRGRGDLAMPPYVHGISWGLYQRHHHDDFLLKRSTSQ
jgi:hypothetical protein